MRLEIFCVRDRKTEAYLNPMFLMAKGQAIRGFGDEVNRADKDNMFYQHPEDFDLFFLGWWDSSSGRFELVATGPEQVVLGSDLVTQR